MKYAFIIGTLMHRKLMSIAAHLAIGNLETPNNKYEKQMIEI